MGGPHYRLFTGMLISIFHGDPFIMRQTRLLIGRKKFVHLVEKRDSVEMFPVNQYVTVNRCAASVAAKFRNIMQS
jgi:hypothetical protein